MDTKICTKCKQEKPVGDFSLNRGRPRPRCKECSKAEARLYNKNGYYRNYLREYYKRPEAREQRKKRMIEYRTRPAVRIKNLARWFVNHEIRSGRLNRQPCAFCGEEQGEAHHKDYTQPLMIVWLCKACHHQVHIEMQDTRGGN
ncbi:hypothetical protein LCGC14_1795390 [marine sediment metagenome]|uniref:Uncharacterized protein n=1 Tax=marine sediment metagenome TaxID=412755 RepID=A0A0F9J636_9ZZZZ